MKLTIKRNTPEEEQAIQRGIEADPDARPWTDAEYAAAVPAVDALPAAVFNELTRRRGPGLKARKALVSLRLDRDVLDGLRATGSGWQGRANEALRKLAQDGRPPGTAVD